MTPVLVTVAPIIYWRPYARPERGGVQTIQSYRGLGPSGFSVPGEGHVWLIGDDGAQGTMAGVNVAARFHSIDWDRTTADVVTCLWL